MAQSIFYPERISRNQEMVLYHKGDEKKYTFPVHQNWRYQLALKVVMINTKTRETRVFGRALYHDYAYSRARIKFNFPLMYNEAIEQAYDQIGGAESLYDPVIKKQWKHLKPEEIWIQLRRYVKPEYVDGKKAIPARYKDVVFMRPKKTKKTALQSLSAKKKARKAYRKAYNQRPQVKLANKLRKRAARRK